MTSASQSSSSSAVTANEGNVIELEFKRQEVDKYLKPTDDLKVGYIYRLEEKKVTIAAVTSVCNKIFRRVSGLQLKKKIALTVPWANKNRGKQKKGRKTNRQNDKISSSRGDRRMECIYCLQQSHG